MPQEKTAIVPTVLLVDDQPDNLVALEAVLKPLGVRLVKARSGDEALMHLLRETFAVILLDVQMPRLDGLQTAELIKQREQTRHIPIIFITAMSRETAYIFKGYAHGAVDYLLKPVDPEILRAKVRVFCDLFVRGEKIRQQALESEVKDVFLGAVVQELQTPLAAAKAQAQLALHQLAERRAEPAAAQALRIISKEIDHLERMVGDLLDISRLDAGTFDLQPSVFEVRSLLEAVHERMQTSAGRHPLTIRAPDDLRITADRDRLEQVLQHLLDNAMQYSPEGGPIEIEARRAGDGVHIVVKDRGLGVPPEEQQQIFERFGRAHGPTLGGLGLGLTISKGIVERHGGSIWVESQGRPGEGSTFHVRLPARAAERSI